LKTIEQTSNHLDTLINGGSPFYFVRFGDGDLTLIQGAPNEQRHRNSVKLRQELREALQIFDLNYVVASTAGSFEDGSGSYFWIKNRVQQQILDGQLRHIWKLLRGNPDEGYHALIFQYAFEHKLEWFVKFIDTMFYDKKVLLVAGEPLCNSNLIEKMFNIKHTVSFTGVDNAYYALDRKMEEILDKLQTCDIILPVIGMATRVLAKRLWKDHNIRNKSLIDIGVTMDALAEAPHRGWTQRVINEGVIEKYKKYYEVL